MKIRFTDRFERQYGALPEELKTKVDKQIEYLSINPWHPSLRSKKFDAMRNIW